MMIMHMMMMVQFWSPTSNPQKKTCQICGRLEGDLRRGIAGHRGAPGGFPARPVAVVETH